MGPLEPLNNVNGTTQNRLSWRRPNLSIPLPQHRTTLAVPLPLPPSTVVAAINFSDLDHQNCIGSGIGGIVYKVVHRPTDRVYALKVIYGHHEDNVNHQILREVQILRNVNNPNVVKCHEIFDHNSDIQVLMEYMNCGSLEGTHIQQESKLAHLARQVLSGLAYLHRRHIVHRDIKPSNLLVNRDFGVGKILARTLDPCHSAVGTFAYMSPERIDTNLNNGQYDGYAGDIWSFGVSILEFYLGRLPFDVGGQGDWASLMCAICMSQPPQAPSSASLEFREFIACCLQRDSAKRWSASKLLGHPFILQNVSGGIGRNQVQQSLRQMLPPQPHLSS